MTPKNPAKGGDTQAVGSEGPSFSLSDAFSPCALPRTRCGALLRFRPLPPLPDDRAHATGPRFARTSNPSRNGRFPPGVGMVRATARLCREGTICKGTGWPTKYLTAGRTRITFRWRPGEKCTAPCTMKLLAVSTDIVDNGVLRKRLGYVWGEEVTRERTHFSLRELRF